MRSVWSLLLVVPLLAGCSGGDGGGDATDPGDDPAAASLLHVPTWSVGDYWTYRASFGSFTLAVTAETPTEYIVDTDSAEQAFRHEAIEEISYIGSISKAQLSGQEEAGAVRFFDFPLEHGKTWRATWDGESFDMVAHEMEFETFHIQAMQDDVIRRQFQYTNETRWFDWISFHDEAGVERFRMDLANSGTDFAGELVRIDPELVWEDSGSGAEATVTTFDWTPEDAQVYLSLQLTCTQGAVAFAVGPLENAPDAVTGGNSDGYSLEGPCPHDESFDEVIGLEPETGTWGAAVAIAAEDAAYAWQVWLWEFERIRIA